VLRPEIFTHARDWQRLTSTHPKRDGGPYPQEKLRKLKNCLKIQRVRVHNFRNSGSIFSINFFMRSAITARGISSFWNFFCTRIYGTGRPHVWLCHARLGIDSKTSLLPLVSPKITSAVLSPGNRAKPCKCRYVKAVGNFIRKIHCYCTPSWLMVETKWQQMKSEFWRKSSRFIGILAPNLT